MHLVEGCVVLNVSDIVSNNKSLLGHIAILPKEKYSTFTRVTRYCTTVDFGVSINHEVSLLLNHF